jgi:acyltransferase-like protein
VSSPADLLPRSPMHLWFIWYLLLASLLWMMVRSRLGNRPAVTRLRNVVVRNARSFWLLPVLVLLTSVLAWLQPAHEFAPQGSFIPNAATFAMLLVFFGFGWLMRSEPAVLESACDRPWAKFAVAAGLWMPGLMLYLQVTGPGEGGAGMAALVVLEMTIVWTLCLSLFGLFRRYVPDRAAAPVGYFADSAYWVYLTHVPFVLITLWATTSLGVPLFFRFWLILGFALLAPLVLYGRFVRYSWLGNVLHGDRARPGTERRPRAASDTALTPAALSPQEAAAARPA